MTFEVAPITTGNFSSKLKLLRADAATKFLERNNLLTVIRAHEAQIEGFKMHKWSGSDFPLVITIFSAPNYCDIYNNKGAVIKFDVSLRLSKSKIEQYAEYSTVQLYATPLLAAQLYGRLHLVNPVRG